MAVSGVGSTTVNTPAIAPVSAPPAVTGSTVLTGTALQSKAVAANAEAAANADAAQKANAIATERQANTRGNGQSIDKLI
jgi:hypothetical protein